MSDQTTNALPVIGLDADDTLWENEAWFATAEHRFCDLVAPWADHQRASVALLATDRKAVARYGYGVKGFVLSMIRTAIHLSDGAVSASEITTIMDLGDEVLDAPVELLPEVRDTLEKLVADYRLLVITKGDITDQMTKVDASGLADLFWEVEVVGEKNETTYRAVLARYGIDPLAFTMVGNSVVSDVLPVLALGGRAIHIPHHTTWELEVADTETIEKVDFPVLSTISGVPNLLADWV